MQNTRREMLGLLAAGIAAYPWYTRAAPAQSGVQGTLASWRGFNIQDKLAKPSELPFQEDDFDFVAQSGFNFVRIPTDYRIWTNDPGRYDESKLKPFDEMIGWAASRSIHVNLCLHRAPGYCVAGPVDSLNLWADGPPGDEARRQFAAQWGMLAQRYAHIPSAQLSFNLVNEPPAQQGSRYAWVMSGAIAAIRAARPDRIIIADGLAGARCMMPVPDIAAAGIVQSLHAYLPQTVAMYKSASLDRHETLPPPGWPTANRLNGYLYGNVKKPWQAPLTILHDFAAPATLQLRVESISFEAHLVIKAGEQTIFDRLLKAGPQGGGVWKYSTSLPTSHGPYYQVADDEVMTASIPAGTRQISIEVVEGDWMTFSALNITPFAGVPGGTLEIAPGLIERYVRQGTFRLDSAGHIVPLHGPAVYGAADLWADELEPWAAAAGQGAKVHIGEWGVTNAAPYEAALNLMRDQVRLFRQAGFGWAFWYLRGPWGVLDGSRDGARYDTWRGHKVDRAMLDILKSK